ncbi:hypothetical protein IS55_1200 [Staphylococcus aureus subsp. aureus IS-55]|nr:hypothetical protein IS55_1200 [Staphylococcus aureus subsp. aureus IS-55]
MKAKNSDFKGGDKMDLNKINVFLISWLLIWLASFFIRFVCG